MNFRNLKKVAGLLRLILIAVCCLLTLSCVQSCSEKPVEGGDDTDSTGPPPWIQSKVDLCASWSPDGKKIIYMRERADAGKDTSWQFGAFIRDMETGRDTCIWPNELFDGFSWAPDGKRLVVIRGGAPYIYDFDTGEFQLINSPGGGFSPSWSVCGDKIVFFDRFNGHGMQVYDVEADSILTDAIRRHALAGDWMPNCSSVVVIDSCRGAPCKLYGYDTYVDSLWLISNTIGRKWNLAVSPNGEAVALTVEHNLWSVPIAGGQPVPLTTEGGGYPDWSPDGEWIVYTKDNRYNGYLWLMRPDGSEKHQLTF